MVVHRISGTELVDPRDLLELLRQSPLPIPFELTFYSAESSTQVLQSAIRTVCRPTGSPSPCIQECLHAWRETITQALSLQQPAVHCCSQGYLGFAVPLPARESLPDCLLGGGVRDGQASRFTSNPRPQGGQVHALRQTADPPQAPQTDREAARIMATDLYRSLPGLLDQNLHTLSLDRTTRRLDAVRDICRDLSRCTTAEQAMSMACEALVVLFDLPGILVLRQQPDNSLALHSRLGPHVDDGQVDSLRFLEYLAQSQGETESMTSETLGRFIAGLQVSSALLVPLCENARPNGAVVLLDVELHARDRIMVELLVGQLAARLEHLRLDEVRSREQRDTNRLVGMISTLSMIDNRDKLLNAILDMSAELLGAIHGSLMLVDDNEGNLIIAAARGMPPALVRNMALARGEGFAGRVAQSGFPMLVNDIERDNRTATRNRPRFKTKSFVSIPLRTRDRLIGVLNLADKADGSSFTADDLDLVQKFCGHAVPMIDHATALEQVGEYEKLSVTDALTGLYNRRFLESRLQEEINRGQRQGQGFCVILADLDNFKVYNDVCGHLAGDRALRKAATLMRRTAREMDVVTRYGGEEFCLVLPATSKQESVFVGDRVRRAIESGNFPGETHLPLGRLTISLGVASFPEDGKTAAELLNAADLALYRAKAMGRNRLVLFDPALETRAPLQDNLKSQA